MENIVNKYGDCPNCGISWEGHDVYNELNSLDALAHKSQKDIKAMAGNYGWSESNPVKLSKVIVIQIGEKMFFKCPEIRCGKIYDTETGLGYNNIEDAKKGAIILESNISEELEFDKPIIIEEDE